ncbi:hypothetical protein [Stenotrophomonas sp. YIM B06876]|uniref:hypothetical protein n=1 Tax=Stenotrophomonas sp. YIM B06876 TaxID=3060211 RepID=UPI002739D51F|nr:hypothetical protein [Stenotrophomonas sp. YIM B06876]
MTQEQLQEVVARRFPQHYPVAGLLSLDLQAPVLRLLPQTNQINATMVAELSGNALKRSYSGGLDVDFSLRYEPSDHTLRAHQIHINALMLNDLPPALADMLQTYAPALAEKTLDEVTLHQLRDKDLALAQGAGLQPGQLTVTDRGLVMELVPVPKPQP